MAILVATDLTPHDHAARELAAVLARRLGESLVLVHVLEHGDTEQTVAGELAKAVAEVGRFGVATDHVVLQGGSPQTLMDYARRITPSMIVVGTPHAAGHQAHRFAKTHALLSRLEVPVLCGSNVAPLMSALMGCRRPRVLAALGDSPATDAAVMKTVEELRHVIPSECTFFAGGHEPANEALRTRASSGTYDLIVAGAKAHSPILDHVVDGELCSILFVTPHRTIARAHERSTSQTSEPVLRRKRQTLPA